MLELMLVPSKIFSWQQGILMKIITKDISFVITHVHT